MFADEVKQRRVWRGHLRGPLQRTNAATELIIVDKQKTLVDALLESSALRTLITGENPQAQLLSSLALVLFLCVLLTPLNPEAFKLVVLNNSIVGQETNQRLHQAAIEMCVLGLAK